MDLREICIDHEAPQPSHQILGDINPKLYWVGNLHRRSVGFALGIGRAPVSIFFRPLWRATSAINCVYRTPCGFFTRITSTIYVKRPVSGNQAPARVFGTRKSDKETCIRDYHRADDGAPNE